MAAWQLNKRFEKAEKVLAKLPSMSAPSSLPKRQGSIVTLVPPPIQGIKAVRAQLSDENGALLTSDVVSWRPTECFPNSAGPSGRIP